MRKLLIVIMTFSLIACGTAQTVVIEPPKTRSTFSSIVIVANNPAVDVPPEITSIFEQELRKGLFEEGPFTVGNDLKLVYTFVGQDSGDRLARWFWGGIGNAGEGSLTVLVRYVDSSGAEIAKTQVEGRIGSGFFGGSMDDAVIKAAQDVAKYTVSNFKQ